MIRLEERSTASLGPRGWGEVCALDDRAFLDDPFADGDREHVAAGLQVLAWEGDDLVGHAAVAEREVWIGSRSWRAGYVEVVAVDPVHQGRGVGTELMTGLVSVLERYDLGLLATGAHRFYERLGWERWQGPTWVRGGDGEHRSPDADDALMVLRLGASIDLDPSAPIACRDRRGDPW